MLVSLNALRSSVGLRVSNNKEDELLKLEHFLNLINLREVDIKVEDFGDLKRIEEGILAALLNMRTLKMSNYVIYDESNLPPLSEKMLDMKDLEILHLWRFAVPRWICGFSNLMRLKLWRCHCADYPALQTMPKLISLVMIDNRNCRVLSKGFGEPRGFPQLRYLVIQYFPLLEELPELEDGAMPRLEILHVFSCSSLKKVPCGLELLKSLKECEFLGTGRNALREEIKEGGEYRNKVKEKNPNVKIVSDDPRDDND